MRVLAVTSEWPTDEHPSSGIFIVRQIEAIRQLGHEVDVEPFGSSMNPRNYVAVRRRIRQRTSEGEYDIVHAHVGQALLHAVGSPVPLVATFYGSDLVGVVGTNGRYTAKGMVLSRLNRWAARRADEVIVVASSLGRLLPRGVSFTVVPTAVDREAFTPGSQDDARQTLGIPVDRRVVLFAGRPWVPVKRYGLARRAVDAVESDVPVEMLTVSGLMPADVETYLRASDVLLLTSKHEGSPATVKEALACGLPVVSVDVGDVRETIGSVPGCVVTDDDSVEAIAAALGAVLGDPKRLDVATLPSSLDQSEQAARVVEVYERVLRRRGSPQARAS
jgi:glycosyltransferase involved in cell wall biosynthesis